MAPAWKDRVFGSQWAAHKVPCLIHRGPGVLGSGPWELLTPHGAKFPVEPYRDPCDMGQMSSPRSLGLGP